MPQLKTEKNARGTEYHVNRLMDDGTVEWLTADGEFSSDASLAVMFPDLRSAGDGVDEAIVRHKMPPAETPDGKPNPVKPTGYSRPTISMDRYLWMRGIDPVPLPEEG